MGVVMSRDPLLRSRSLYAIAVPSVGLSVCPSVVCNVRAPYFGGWNWHPRKILRRSSKGNPSVGGYKSKRASQI